MPAEHDYIEISAVGDAWMDFYTKEINLLGPLELGLVRIMPPMIAGRRLHIEQVPGSRILLARVVAQNLPNLLAPLGWEIEPSSLAPENYTFTGDALDFGSITNGLYQIEIDGPAVELSTIVPYTEVGNFLEFRVDFHASSVATAVAFQIRLEALDESDQVLLSVASDQDGFSSAMAPHTVQIAGWIETPEDVAKVKVVLRWSGNSVAGCHQPFLYDFGTVFQGYQF